MRSRVTLIASVVLLVGGGGWLTFRAFRADDRPKNVILISIDTCRADYLGCYGHPRDITPNIDAFAQESVLFSNAISPVPLTLPAHCSIFTGTIPPSHGVHDNINYQLADVNVTLAERLRDHGYHTAAVIGAVVLDAKTGMGQGFDTFDDRLVTSFPGTGGRPERRAQEVSRIANAWLDQHAQEPFFLFLHYYDPHHPYVPPEPFASSFAEDPYAGEIAYTDRCIADVFAKLKAKGLYDSSVVIVLGDHGEAFGEHGETEHGYYIYHTTTKVPLIIRPAGHNEARRIDETVSLVDIVPTVLTQLGVPPATEIQGEDLSPYVSGDPADRSERYLFSESMIPTKYGCNSLLGVETREWKYIQTTEPELYDLKLDPSELNNLAGEQPERARLLQTHLGSILSASQSFGPADSSATIDQERLDQLRTLGYAGGPVEETFEFDTNREDPKSFIELHTKIESMKHCINRGDFAAAKQLGEEVVAVRPGVVEARTELARIAIEQGNTEEAITQYSEALRYDPDSTDAASWHNNMGILLAQEDRVEEAVQHYHEALRLARYGIGDPADRTPARSATRGIEYLVYSIHLNLGSALLRQGKPAEAVREFEMALRTNPRAPAAHYQLGTALSEMGRLDEAVGAFQETLRLDPGNTAARRALDAALTEQQRSRKP